MYQPTITEVSIVGAPVPSHPIQSPNVPYVEMQQQVIIFFL